MTNIFIGSLFLGLLEFRTSNTLYNCSKKSDVSSAELGGRPGKHIFVMYMI